MSLRHRFSLELETVQGFELAAEDTYWAALELITAGYQLRGMYLLGFAGEMLLKNACFRFQGAKFLFRASTPVDATISPEHRA
jgi:hypothetical protein